MDILGQISWEDAGLLLGGLILVLGGKEGVIFMAGRRTRRNNQGKYVSEEMCALRHESLKQQQDERHQAVLGAILGIKTDLTTNMNKVEINQLRLETTIGKLHERIDKLVDHS